MINEHPEREEKTAVDKRTVHRTAESLQCEGQLAIHTLDDNGGSDNAIFYIQPGLSPVSSEVEEQMRQSLNAEKLKRSSGRLERLKAHRISLHEAKQVRSMKNAHDHIS